MNLHLSSEEAQLLDRTLKWRLSMLLTEIHHTDRRAFREELKRLASELERLLERLTEAEHASKELRA